MGIIRLIGTMGTKIRFEGTIEVSQECIDIKKATRFVRGLLKEQIKEVEVISLVST